MKTRLFAAVLSIGVMLFGGQALAAENIPDFQTSIYVSADGTLKVDESITYDYDQSQGKHGIFRDIPVRYTRAMGDYKTTVTDVLVDDGKNPIPFTIIHNGDNLRIKIGDADTVVSGVKLYNIHYKVDKAINFFKDHDEIYWNVTGNDWPVTITQAAAKIYFPSELDSDKVKSDCYSGPRGSQEKCLSQRLVFSGKDKVTSAVFAGEMFKPGSGLTAVVSLPKGIIREAPWWRSLLDFALANSAVFVPVAVIISLFVLWRKRGRDPKGNGTIIAQYDAPDNLTPTEVGTIVDESASNSDISADIIHLAINGYLKINRIENEGLVFKSSDYLLEKLKSEDGLTNEFEKMLMRGLFESGDKVKMSELNEKFYKVLGNIKKEIYDTVTAKGYFVANPQKTRMWYFIAGGLTVFAGIILSGFSFYLAVGLAVSGLAIASFGYVMPRKTEQGVAAYEHILGLKRYLSVAEKDRIDFHNDPAKNPQIFEKLLPYAMVLKVEEKWAKQFEGIYDDQPAWYSDPANQRFAPIVFVHSLNGFSSAANSSMAAMPNSGAGGGASGMGGGFSGGGFGGGGGGSW